MEITIDVFGTEEKVSLDLEAEREELETMLQHRNIYEMSLGEFFVHGERAYDRTYEIEGEKYNFHDLMCLVETGDIVLSRIDTGQVLHFPHILRDENLSLITKRKNLRKVIEGEKIRREKPAIIANKFGDLITADEYTKMKEFFISREDSLWQYTIEDSRRLYKENES
jgi:hypothetical protein